MPAKPKAHTINGYLAGVKPEHRSALEELRKIIKAAAPEAEECINYGICAFRVNGKSLIGFGAAAKHCSLFPMDGHTVQNFQSELNGFETSKGSIHFTAKKPLPADLVRKLVKTRLKEVSPTVNAQSAVAELKRLATKAWRDGLARYGIPSDNALGVTAGKIQQLAKRLGRNHDLALELWKTGFLEARMLTAYVDEPDKVTPAQMDRWCRDFDNWAIVDTLCFALWDRTPHAWKKVSEWSNRREEFVRRAAFALLWGLTVHDKQAEDASFLQSLKLIECAAEDDRHFVSKAVNMALRAIGKRNQVLNTAAVTVAKRLAESANTCARRVGKHALKELTSLGVQRRLAKRRTPTRLRARVACGCVQNVELRSRAKLAGARQPISQRHRITSTYFRYLPYGKQPPVPRPQHTQLPQKYAPP